MKIVKQNNYILYIIKESSNDIDYFRLTGYIKRKPTAPKGYDYRLRDDLTWEIYELPTEEEEA